MLEKQNGHASVITGGNICTLFLRHALMKMQRKRNAILFNNKQGITALLGLVFFIVVHKYKKLSPSLKTETNIT